MFVKLKLSDRLINGEQRCVFVNSDHIVSLLRSTDNNFTYVTTTISGTNEHCEPYIDVINTPEEIIVQIEALRVVQSDVLTMKRTR